MASKEDLMEEDNGEEGADRRDEEIISDSDSDSDSDSEDEELDALKLGITGLEQRVRDTHGRDYDAHALLVRVLREKSQMGKLEKARKAFSKNFPLPEGGPFLGVGGLGGDLGGGGGTSAPHFLFLTPFISMHMLPPIISNMHTIIV